MNHKGRKGDKAWRSRELRAEPADASAVRV